MSRKFKHSKAKRERLPLLIGTIGPSGSGKTYSALRLATGMQRVTGGKIFYIDTESRRALHYADEFDFEHVPMDAPFSPNDYLEVIQYCKSQGATIVVVDSMSHEHEGPGGVLEMHEAFLDERAGNDWNKRNKLTMSAWIKPKAQRRRLINEILRMGINGVFCFRAKPKIKIVTGKDPVDLGWQAIAGDEFVYEMTVNCLLYPGAKGVPNWKPDQHGELSMTKIPGKLEHVFKKGQPLSEDVGEALAHWAAGEVDDPDLDEALRRINNSTTRKGLDEETEIAHRLREWTADESKTLRAAVQAKRAALKSPPSEPSDPPERAAGTGDPAEPQAEMDPETGEEIPAHIGAEKDGQGRLV